jgi:hypothetical protein
MPPPTLQASNTPADKPIQAEVVLAYNNANSVATEARRTLDPTSLPRAYAGTALDNQYEHLLNLHQNGAFSVDQLLSQRIESVELSSDSRHAWIKASEVWRVTFYSIVNRLCISWVPSQEVSLTATLDRNGSAWLVTEVQWSGPPVTPISCQ